VRTGRTRLSSKLKPLEFAPAPVWIKFLTRWNRYSKLLEKNPKFDCIVCLETLPIAERPSRAPTRKCKHSPNVCRGCLSDMLKHAVGTGNFKELKCPAASTDKCEGLLDGKDVGEFADRDTFKKSGSIHCYATFFDALILNRYDNFMMDDLLKSDPAYRWCQKRNDGGICGWGQLHPRGGAFTSVDQSWGGAILIGQQTLFRGGNARNAMRAIASIAGFCGTKV
jgi:hypothetical protein